MKELALVTVVAYEVVYAATVPKREFIVPVTIKTDHITWLW